MHQMSSAVLITILFSSSCVAATIYVDKSATPGGTGTSWATAFNELEDALAVAGAGDQIWIAQGTYIPDMGTTRNVSCFTLDPSLANRARSFLIPGGVSLYGGFSGTETSLGQRTLPNTATVLSGDALGNDIPGDYSTYSDNYAQVVTTDPASQSNITIDRLMISGGAADLVDPFFGTPIPDFCSGAAILNLGNHLTISNVVIKDNWAQDAGAGIASVDGNLIVLDSDFENNNLLAGHGVGGCDIEAQSLGGASIYFDCLTTSVCSIEFTAINCTFNDSTSPDGKGPGGVYIGNSAQATFIDCEFTNLTGGFKILGGQNFYNTASAIQTYPETTITGCDFTSNSGGSAVSDFFFDPLANLHVIDSTFTSNLSNEIGFGSGTFEASGGAISSYRSGNTITGCTFNNNSVPNTQTNDVSKGGAVRAYSTTTITDCVFTGNSAEEGGAIYGFADSIARCVFQENSADTTGGALYAIVPSALIVDNALFIKNSAASAGALFLDGGSAPSIINCTVADNTASGETGGIVSSTSTTNLINTIVWGNTGSGGTLNDQLSGSFTASYTCVDDPTMTFGGAGMEYGNPQFLDSVNGDYRLNTNTPCRDAGNNAALDTDGDMVDDIILDLNGATRLQGPNKTVDMGAFERCFADYNNDGSVNFFDGSQFIIDYNSGNLDADLNADGVLDFFDISTFTSLNNAGCN